MPFHRPCAPIAYSLSVPNPHRVIHRLTADQVDTSVTFSIPPGPWTVFMFAAVDGNGSITEPFSVSWSSTPLVPRQWYSVPTVSHEPTDLQISREFQISRGSEISRGSYGIILLLAGSTSESKPLTH
jgi:hypothetical protein